LFYYEFDGKGYTIKFSPSLFRCLIDKLETVIWKPEQGYTTFAHEGKANIKIQFLKAWALLLPCLIFLSTIMYIKTDKNVFCVYRNIGTSLKYDSCNSSCRNF